MIEDTIGIGNRQELREREQRMDEKINEKQKEIIERKEKESEGEG